MDRLHHLVLCCAAHPLRKLAPLLWDDDRHAETCTIAFWTVLSPLLDPRFDEAGHAVRILKWRAIVVLQYHPAAAPHLGSSGSSSNSVSVLVQTMGY